MINYSRCFIIKLIHDEYTYFIPMVHEETETGSEWVTIKSGKGYANMLFDLEDSLSFRGKLYNTLKTYFEEKNERDTLSLGDHFPIQMLSDKGLETMTSYPEEMILWVMGHIPSAINYDDIVRMGYPLFAKSYSSDGKVKLKRMMSSEMLVQFLLRLIDRETTDFIIPDIPSTLSEEIGAYGLKPVDSYYVIDMSPNEKRKEYFSSRRQFVKHAIGVSNPVNALKFSSEEEAMNIALTYMPDFKSDGFDVIEIKGSAKIPVNLTYGSEYWTTRWSADLIKSKKI